VAITSSLDPPQPPAAAPARSAALLAWAFVLIWGSGFVATKLGLQYVAPFTFLVMRFTFGLVLLVPLALLWHRRDPLRWPRGAGGWAHVTVAGLLMHAVNLGGSHYGQYLGISAGVVALVLALQPLVTAAFAAAALGERLLPVQWAGVGAGLLGVALVVWHKIDVRAATPAALTAVGIALAAITSGTLYQRRFCPTVDLRAASVIQFAATLLVMVPLALTFEADRPRHFGWPLLGAIAFLVILASIVAVNALHTLMRRGQAARVTSLLYLTPIIAVLLEWALFGVRPSLLTVVGMLVTCAAVIAVVRPQARRAAGMTAAPRPADVAP
jgi:drug/metabolite transporter (DMT)-like permease